MRVVSIVKHSFLLFAALIFFVQTAVPVEAATQTNEEHAALLARIEMLTEKLLKLQNQLALLTKPKVAEETEFLYKTRFHRGSYEGLYTVKDGELEPIGNAAVRKVDQQLWDTFAEITGSEFIDTYIGEFRVYNDTKSEVSAFIEEKPNDTWILGFNREGEELSEIYNDSSTVELFLHEYGHIVFFKNEKIGDDFAKKFWEGANKQYDDAPELYVTEYAATSPSEDLAESFVQFILLREVPTGTEAKFNKIRFFYEYPQMTKLRLELRESNLF